MLVHPLEEKEFALPLSPFLFLSQRVLVFALLLCPPPHYTFSCSFCLYLRALEAPSSPLFHFCCSTCLLHYAPPPPPPTCGSLTLHLFPSCQDLHQQTCESTEICKKKRPFNPPDLSVCSAFVAPRPAPGLCYTAIIVLITHLMLAF